MESADTFFRTFPNLLCSESESSWRDEFAHEYLVKNFVSDPVCVNDTHFSDSHLFLLAHLSLPLSVAGEGLGQLGVLGDYPRLQSANVLTPRTLLSCP